MNKLIKFSQSFQKFSIKLAFSTELLIFFLLVFPNNFLQPIFLFPQKILNINEFFSSETVIVVYYLLMLLVEKFINKYINLISYIGVTYFMFYISIYMILAMLNVVISKTIYSMSIAVLIIFVHCLVRLIYCLKKRKSNTIINLSIFSLVLCLMILYIVSMYTDYIKNNFIALLFEGFILIAGLIIFLYDLIRNQFKIFEISLHNKEKILKLFETSISYLLISIFICISNQWDSSQKWISILIVSIVLGLILIAFWIDIKEIEFGIVAIFYFLIISLVPIFIFIAYISRNEIGNYIIFRSSLIFIITLTAIALLALGGSDIKELVLKGNDLGEKNKIKIARARLYIENATILVTLFNSCFTDQNSILNICNSISRLCNKIKLFSLPSSANAEAFKIALFVLTSFIIIILGSQPLLGIEKYIFKKLIKSIK